MTLIKTKSNMATLLGQFKIYTYKIGRKNFSDFRLLVTEQGITEDELMVYCNHIETLTTDMKTRFNLVIFFNWKNLIGCLILLCI